MGTKKNNIRLLKIILKMKGVKMRIFKLNKKYEIACEFVNKSDGFGHRATLFCNGQEIGSSTARYYNRTWEAFEFETVLLICIDDNFEGKEKEKFRNIIKAIKY
jgi:hypothetical protein